MGVADGPASIGLTMNLATRNPRLRRATAVGVLLTNGQVISVPVPRSGPRRDLGRVVARLASRA
jgi:hypothetical protein